jgi:hypothetical protein
MIAMALAVAARVVRPELERGIPAREELQRALLQLLADRFTRCVDRGKEHENSSRLALRLQARPKWPDAAAIKRPRGDRALRATRRPSPRRDTARCGSQVPAAAVPDAAVHAAGPSLRGGEASQLAEGPVEHGELRPAARSCATSRFGSPRRVA